MIIDCILDRKYDDELMEQGYDSVRYPNGEVRSLKYDAHKFYYDVFRYGEIGHEITRAMDGGTEQMKQPEFGGMFFDQAQEQGAVMYWGARGAIRNRRLEIYPDRQGFTADSTENKGAFVGWINDHLIPYLEQRVKQYNTKRIEAHDKAGRFHAVAEDRDSGGYLYIGAWAI